MLAHVTLAQYSYTAYITSYCKLRSSCSNAF